MRFAFDTNVWQYATVDLAFSRLLTRLVPVGLSAVVASELLRDSRTEQALTAARDVVTRFEHSLLAPTVDDWLHTADCLRALRKRYRDEPVGLMRMQNDALIAISALRVGWTVVTTNRIDFERIGEVLGKRRLRCLFLDAPKVA